MASSSRISHYDSVNTSLEQWKPFQAYTLSESRKPPEPSKLIIPLTLSESSNPIGPLSFSRRPLSSGDQEGSTEDGTRTPWATSDVPHTIVSFSPYNVAMNTTDSTHPGLSSRASTAQMRLPLADSYSGYCPSSNGDCFPVLDSPSMSVFPSNSSVCSETSAAVPATLPCPYDGCRLKFDGKYRRGTLHRHIRLKHTTGRGSVDQETKYFCQVPGCGKYYRRQDARLKHQRNKHPELAVPAPMSRK
jgi:hypothetical protein